MLLSHGVMWYMRSVRESMALYCEKRFVGGLVPKVICPPEPVVKTVVNVTNKALESQEILGKAMKTVGHNHELARAMTRHEGALGILRARVAASNSSARKVWSMSYGYSSKTRTKLEGALQEKQFFP